LAEVAIVVDSNLIAKLVDLFDSKIAADWLELMIQPVHLEELKLFPTKCIAGV
jgi:hypothetical protein